MDQTRGKLRGRPLTGKEGNTFSKDNQPDPALKKAGWEELRKRRFLTQLMLKEMLGEDGEPTDNLKQYIAKLVKLAGEGNAKAIETVNKCLEDDIMKIAQTDKDGNDVLVGPFKVEIIAPNKD